MWLAITFTHSWMITIGENVIKIQRKDFQQRLTPQICTNEWPKRKILSMNDLLENDLLEKNNLYSLLAMVRHH